MGNTSAHHNQPLFHNYGADDTAGKVGQYYGENGVLQKTIMQQIVDHMVPPHVFSRRDAVRHGQSGRQDSHKHCLRRRCSVPFAVIVQGCVQTGQ